MLDITLYGKDGCHLCDDVRDMLHELSRRYPHRLQEIDINGDPALFARYRLSIPVVKFGNHVLKAPIDPQQLEQALQKAANQEGNAQA